MLKSRAPADLEDLRYGRSMWRSFLLPFQVAETHGSLMVSIQHHDLILNVPTSSDSKKLHNMHPRRPVYIQEVNQLINSYCLYTYVNQLTNRSGADHCCEATDSQVPINFRKPTRERDHRSFHSVHPYKERCSIMI